MKKEKGYRCYSGKPDSFYSCNTLLSPGIHNLVDVPSEFCKLEEILVLGDYDPKDDSVKSDSNVHAAIFAFNFSNNKVEVIPQDWFNNGHYDFAYQWITRVVRDPQTQRIFGDGIRLARFQLDETGRNREQSISQMSVLRALLNKIIGSNRKRSHSRGDEITS